MAGPTWPVGAKAVKGETLSLSTTLASLGRPAGTTQLNLYNPSTDFRMMLNPRILGVHFFNLSDTAGTRFTNNTVGTTNRNSSTGTTLSSAVDGDYLYICLSDPVTGLRVDVGNTNTTTSALTIGKLNTSNTFDSLSITDGTSASSKTFNQYGTITWSLPSDWPMKFLKDNGSTSAGPLTDVDAPTEMGHWLRLSWDATLDSSVTIQDIWTINQSTDRGYFRAGTEYSISLDQNVGAFEAILASGTDTLQATWVR